jgi:ABC-type multidrug transport system ATPase subunit
MHISVEHISKRYTTGWVIKDFSKEIPSKSKIAITGPNGSGKSTLIQMIAGYLSCTKGEIVYTHNEKVIPRDMVYQHIAISAAYAELDEEYTPTEIYEHYGHFKKFLTSDVKEFLQLADLKRERHQCISSFSSGMKQRLSIALASIMDVPLLIMDEPSSFLDTQRKSWYQDVLNNFTQEKTVIIASNDPLDYSCCDDVVFIT